ncbi:hypothetical protein ACFVW2_01875 [Streptomyces sp. NPDC058171]
MTQHTTTPRTTPHPTPDTVLERRSSDSSHLTEPRVFLRVFTGPGTLEALTSSYERLLDTERDLWFTYPEKQLALSAVGAFLLIEGTEEVLAPFRATHGTLLVASVSPYLARLEAEGAEILVPVHRVPTGSGFTARHADGLTVEYVEHRPDEYGR